MLILVFSYCENILVAISEVQSHKIVHLNTKVGPSSGQWAADAATDTSTDYLCPLSSGAEMVSGRIEPLNIYHLPGFISKSGVRSN